jgi:hypothetical protein
VPSRSGLTTSTTENVAERVRAILASKGLTLYQVSQQSIGIYGRFSPYFVPHNLYYDLRHASFTPSIYQVFALSRISGYRIFDWFRVFGIDLENIPRLQALLPRKRTALIDNALTDNQAWVQWFRSQAGHGNTPAIAPLSLLLERVGFRRITSLPRATVGKFLYAKIGTQDALAFPDLLPGSIVRADPKLIAESFPRDDGRVSERIFLLEHSKGFFCSRVRRVQENIIVPVGTKLSYAQVELRLRSEAKLLGVLDFEIRSLAKAVCPGVPNELAKLWKPEPILEGRNLHQLLTTARTNSGLSFREAASDTQTVSEMLADERYRIAASSICDYEVQGVPPRGLHKIATLCSIYGLTFHAFLRSAGIPVEQVGIEAMADRLAGRSSSEESRSEEPRAQEPTVDASLHPGLLEHLIELCEEAPFFLRNVMAAFVGLREISLADLFWIGGDRQPLYPYLTSGRLVVVNRRRKTPSHFPSKPVWKQPVYLLLKRDGSYLCACSDIQNSTLVVHPYTEHVHGPLQFRRSKDIEVIGQIIAIVRTLS